MRKHMMKSRDARSSGFVDSLLPMSRSAHADYVPVMPDEWLRAAMGLVVIAAITLVGWVSTQAWMAS